MESGNNKEIQLKHDRVRELLMSSRLDGLLFAKNSNFKWFSGGKLNDVIKNEDTSLVYLFITGDRRYLIASRSDTDRVMSEELKDWISSRYFTTGMTSRLMMVLRNLEQKMSEQTLFLMA